MKNVDGRSVLDTRVPINIVVRNWIVVIIFSVFGIWLLFTPIAVGHSKIEVAEFMALPLSMIIAAVLFQIYISRGYRLSYDDDHVYFRPDGVSWKTSYHDEWMMRYADIDVVVAEHGRMNMEPFEYVALWRKTWDGREQFFLSRFFLKDEELRVFLHFLHSKIPEKIPQEVIDFLGNYPNISVPFKT